MSQSIEAEQEQQEETRRLRQQLEESRRDNSRLGLERDELARNMEEKEKDKDAVRKENTLLDDQRRQQDRALDKLNKEVCAHRHEFESVFFTFCFFFLNFPLLLPPAPFSRFFCQMERLSAASREEVRLLQAQLDEQREKWRKEQQDLHKNTKEKLSELERAQSTIHSLQEEVPHSGYFCFEFG